MGGYSLLCTLGMSSFTTAETRRRQTSSGSSSGSSSSITVDTDAGASGAQSSGFTLSKGGLVAICIMVALVAIFGIVTLTLFIIAKRRQWTVRQTLGRASRRLTGRGGQCPTVPDRPSKRAGLQMDAQPARLGQKRSLKVDVQDVEKGGRSSKPSKSGRIGERLMRDDWKP